MEITSTWHLVNHLSRFKQCTMYSKDNKIIWQELKVKNTGLNLDSSEIPNIDGSAVSSRLEVLTAR